MNLHVETQGSGDPLLLIHGWGMHGGMWQQVAEQLADLYTIHRVDLPGHGMSKEVAWDARNGMEALDQVVAMLDAQFKQPLAVAGWSLGGQVVLRWARQHPQRISKMILVSSTPCFVQQPGWSSAMAANTLQEFANALMQNHTLTLKRFLALQVRGSENEKELLGSLREQLFAKGEPDVKALEIGLAILRDVDLRAEVGEIKQPALVIAGERDMLTPAGASKYMAENMPSAKLHLVEGAAHAPFLSHQNTFVDSVKNFLNE